MVGLGARNIFLLSRGTKVNDEVEKLIQRVQEAGARVAVKACDVSNKSQVDSVIHECANSGGPIHGVIHAAMVSTKVSDKHDPYCLVRFVYLMIRLAGCPIRKYHLRGLQIRK